MEDIKKMLRAIVNTQSLLKEEIVNLRKDMNKGFSDLRLELTGEIQKVNKDLTKRMDKIGKTVAYVEDDTPTRVEHDMLSDRVTKIEKKLAA
jgi:hypothetical protein